MVETALVNSGILEGLEHEEGLLRPAILVSAPSPFNRVQFAENILRALGMETDRRLEPNMPGGSSAISSMPELPDHRRRGAALRADRQAGYDPVHSGRPEGDGRQRSLAGVVRLRRNPALTRFVTTDNQIRGLNTIMKLKQMGLDRETGLLCEDDLALVLDAIDETLARIRLSLPMYS